MKEPRIKVWFPAKKYGWGWGPPCCWQGWLVMLTWLLLLCAGGVYLARWSLGLWVAYAVVLSTIFFVVVYLKGGKPRWRWGENEDIRRRPPENDPP